MAADPETFEIAEKTVIETYVRQVDKLVHITINGEEIVTTDNHPFYVQGRGFIEAGSLLVGDRLISVNGEDLIVEDYHIELTEEPVSVYNFQVEDFHTYFVGDCAVWVHNAECTIEFNNKSGFDEKEFKQQLSDQQDGLNKMTVDEYKKNRTAYKENGRASDSDKYQQAAREKAIAARTEDNIINKNMSYEDACAEANNWAKGKAALHGPDQIAGGNASDITGLGDAKINSSIGSQWKAGSRIGKLDTYVDELASGLSDAEKKTTFLDVELVLK